MKNLDFEWLTDEFMLYCPTPQLRSVSRLRTHCTAFRNRILPEDRPEGRTVSAVGSATYLYPSSGAFGSAVVVAFQFPLGSIPISSGLP